MLLVQMQGYWTDSSLAIFSLDKLVSSSQVINLPQFGDNSTSNQQKKIILMN